MRRLIRSARAIITLGIMAGVLTTAGIVGWVTGTIHRAATLASVWWHRLVVWVNQPWDMSHILASASVLVVPTLIVMGFLVLTDN